MSIILTDKILRRICTVNSFSIPQDEMVFLGFRGMLPVNPEDHTFRTEQNVEVIDVNYINPRCTLGQWLPAKKAIALFPGSTVPHMTYVKESILKNGYGANQLMTGYYSDYRKGIHKPGTPTAHDAFRQIDSHPIRRSSDDNDYDNDDPVEFMNPYDNIHAGWCMGVNATYYSSKGCQVLVGYPQCKKRENKPATGPWKVFKKNAYDLKQFSFVYILLDGREASRIDSAGSSTVPARLRFGSKGDLVGKLQSALKTKVF